MSSDMPRLLARARLCALRSLCLLAVRTRSMRVVNELVGGEVGLEGYQLKPR